MIKGIEFTTMFGIIVGIIAVVGAMIFKHISFSVLINPAAFLVIFVGTAATILNAYPGRDLKNLGKLFKILFTTDKSIGNERHIIEKILELSERSRKEGLLSLETTLATVDEPFMAKALRMIIDAHTEEHVRDVLTGEIDAMVERHNNNASIFTSAGMYAPTLGVLGAVFGLIAAMRHIDNTQAMSEAIAAAFIATILGIFTGYVLWTPFATKLKTKSKHEAFEKMLIIEGMLSVQRGEPPMIVKEKLISLLPNTEQSKYSTKKKSGTGTEESSS